MTAEIKNLWPGIENDQLVKIEPDEHVVAFLTELLAAAKEGKVRGLGVAFMKLEDGTNEPIVGTFYRRAPGTSIFALLGATHDLSFKINSQAIEQYPRMDEYGDGPGTA